MKFLKTSPKNQKEILESKAASLGNTEQILEKDIWVCLVLEKLFSMPDAFNMVFKGGTSLSKAHNLIQRFSEDVDITIAYEQFTTKDPFSLSTTQLKKLSEELKKSLKNYIRDRIAVHLAEEIGYEVNVNYDLKMSSNSESIEIHYDSVLGKTSGYISSYILLEFGARNAIVPNKTHFIKPYLEVTKLEFPSAKVNVLAAERTFWEKATLIHVACNRGIFQKGADRLSRHWYDLATIYKSPVYASAVADKSILEDVIKHKKVFYNAPYAQYDKCLLGGFNLIPNSLQLNELQKDYEEMVKSNMFYGSALSFEEIIATLRELTEELK